MTDKELTVQLAVAALQAMAQMNVSPHKPLTGSDILNIVKDCQSAVRFLDSDSGK